MSRDCALGDIAHLKDEGNTLISYDIRASYEREQKVEN